MKCIAFFLFIVTVTHNALCVDKLDTPASDTAASTPQSDKKGYGSVTINAIPGESIVYLDGKKQEPAVLRCQTIRKGITSFIYTIRKISMKN